MNVKSHPPTQCALKVTHLQSYRKYLWVNFKLNTPHFVPPLDQEDDLVSDD